MFLQLFPISFWEHWFSRAKVGKLVSSLVPFNSDMAANVFELDHLRRLPTHVKKCS